MSKRISVLLPLSIFFGAMILAILLLTFDRQVLAKEKVYYTSDVTHQQYSVRILVDDFSPQPRQGDTVWPHNRLGGDRGQIDGPGGGLIHWGQSAVTATITGGTDTFMGVWTSLNHPIIDRTPLNFANIFPPQILPQYQGQITGLQIDLLNGNGTFQVDLRNEASPLLNQESVKWEASSPISGGPQTLRFSLPLTLNEIQNLNWKVTGDAGDFVVLDRVTFTATVPLINQANQAFLWSYSMLLNNWEPASGLTRDHAYWSAGDFDNVSASGMQAASAVVAWHLGFISEASATHIVTKTAQALLALPHDNCGGGLWPHFVQDGEIISGTEWSSIDTVIALLALLEAQSALNLDTMAIETRLTEINWEALILPDGHISHGYWSDCQPIEPGGQGGWQDFGTESWLVNLGYIATTNKVADFDHSPPSHNGSGFIDELAWLLVPVPCPDRWGTSWCDYRAQALINQYHYYQSHPCYAGPPRWFGLSAGEIPDLSLLPVTQTYQAFGVGGDIPPNDGNSLFGHAVIVPHYAAMVANLDRSKASDFWGQLEALELFSPLNNVESLMFADELTCEKVVWNALKGSWNLSLQTLGWGLSILGDQYPIYQGMWENQLLRNGYLSMLPGVFLPNIPK